MDARGAVVCLVVAAWVCVWWVGGGLESQQYYIRAGGSDLKNYSPVAILNTICRILGAVVINRIALITKLISNDIQRACRTKWPNADAIYTKTTP